MWPGRGARLARVADDLAPEQALPARGRRQAAGLIRALRPGPAAEQRVEAARAGGGRRARRGRRHAARQRGRRGRRVGRKQHARRACGTGRTCAPGDVSASGAAEQAAAVCPVLCSRSASRGAPAGRRAGVTTAETLAGTRSALHLDAHRSPLLPHSGMLTHPAARARAGGRAAPGAQAGMQAKAPHTTGRAGRVRTCRCTAPCLWLQRQRACRGTMPGGARGAPAYARAQAGESRLADGKKCAGRRVGVTGR